MKFKNFFNTAFFLYSYIILATSLNAQAVPASFADLAEKLMPSVVNISTTQIITTKSNSFPFQFPPGSPFEDMFKEFETPKERKATSLGSGFIIDKKGVVVTNNHVIQGAEDIFVRVNGDTEYKAKVLGADPLSDVAILQITSDDTFIPVKFGDGNFIGISKFSKKGAIILKKNLIKLKNRYKDYYTIAIQKMIEEKIDISFVDCKKLFWKEIDTIKDYKELLKKYEK